MDEQPRRGPDWTTHTGGRGYNAQCTAMVVRCGPTCFTMKRCEDPNAKAGAVALGDSTSFVPGVGRDRYAPGPGAGSANEKVRYSTHKRATHRREHMSQRPVPQSQRGWQ